MSYSRFLSAVVCIFLLSACAAAPPPPPDFSYGRDGIVININADPMLNMDEGRPHTLYVCVYQLRDPNAFNRLAGDVDGIYKLLECSQFDPNVTGSRNIIVQPGQKVSYTLDRAEGTRFVAICAGYYNIRREDVVRLYRIPVVTKTRGWLSRTRVTEPEVLKINLDFGPTTIRNAAED